MLVKFEPYRLEQLLTSILDKINMFESTTSPKIEDYNWYINKAISTVIDCNPKSKEGLTKELVEEYFSSSLLSFEPIYGDRLYICCNVQKPNMELYGVYTFDWKTLPIEPINGVYFIKHQSFQSAKMNPKWKSAKKWIQDMVYYCQLEYSEKIYLDYEQAQSLKFIQDWVDEIYS